MAEKFEVHYTNGDPIAYISYLEKQITCPVVMPESYRDNLEINIKRIELAKLEMVKRYG